MMDKVNTVIQNLPPAVVPYAKLLILAVTSLFVNTVVAGKCLVLCGSNASRLKFSYKDYLKLIKQKFKAAIIF
jgi:hypothetical protein